MKKIGIITYFYNSTNYGGILQAYALCKALNSLEGVEAEQISYDYDSHIVKKKKNINYLWSAVSCGLHGKEDVLRGHALSTTF